MPGPHRRLEVVVLSARGLGDLDAADASRRQVELSVVSHLDPEGDEFATKRSPWTLPIGKANSLRFGRSGLRSIFPLAGPNTAGIVETRRFLESAELRVRLMVSGLSTQSTSMSFVKSWLPTSVADGIAKDLDKATAKVEAETRIPLAELLTGTPDAHSNGWVNLRRCQMTGNKLDSLTPQVWMQVYILPDYSSLVATLNEEYEAEGKKLENFRPSLCFWRNGVEEDEDETSKGEAPGMTPTSSQKSCGSAAPPPGAPGAPFMAVVPPGVGPGQMFSVNGPPVVHIVTCPAGLKPGDNWQVITHTGEAMQVQIPMDIKPGMKFQLRVPQVLQVQCPLDAEAGHAVTVQTGPPPQSPNVMQVTMPPDTKAGDKIMVVVPATGQQLVVDIPPGVQPGQPFAVNTAPPPCPGMPGTMPMPPPIMGYVAGPSGSPPQAAAPPPVAVQEISVEAPMIDIQEKAAPAPAAPAAAPAPMTDLLGEVSPEKPATTAAAEPSREANVLDDIFPNEASTKGLNEHVDPVAIEGRTSSVSSAQLAELYRESPLLGPQASPTSPKVSEETKDLVESCDKFAALMCLEADASPEKPDVLSPSAVPGASEPPESFQAMQDSLLTGFSDSFKPPDDPRRRTDS